MNTPIYRRTKGTQPIQNPYNFQPAAPFGGQKRESGNAVSKVCPHRDAQGFFKSRLIRVRKSLRAFDTARKLSQTPNAERCGGKVSGLYRFSWVSVGYCWVFVRAEFIAKAAFLWYNNMDRQAKIIFLPAACAAPLCFRKAALCLNTALANPCKQVCSLALWKHKQAERLYITEK